MDCALFYPDVAPPSSWLKQNLLYYDLVGSIVHSAFMDNPPPDIAWLVETGRYELVLADDLDGDMVSALVDEFAEVLVAYEKRGKKLLPDTSDAMEGLHYGKLPGLVEYELEGLGVIKDIGSRFSIQPFLLGPLVCLVAKLAAVSFTVSDRVYSMHTTNQAASDLCIMPRTSDADLSRALAMTVDAVLPVPRDDVSLADVLQFRDSHRVELLQLRANIESIITEQLARGKDAVRSAAWVRQRIEQERLELFHSMRRAGWRTAFASAVVVSATAATALVAPGAAPWILSGVAPAGVSTALVAVNGRPAPRFSYLHKAARQFS